MGRTRIAAILVALAASTASAAEDGEEELKRVPRGVQRRIDRAVERGVAALREMQHAKGPWRYSAQGHAPTSHHEGTTALALLAMLHSGVPREDAAVRKGVGWILRVGRSDTPDTHRQYVYATGLVLWLLRVDDARGHRGEIARLGGRLAAGIQDGGLWSYLVGPGVGVQASGDLSNTAFAVMGLWEAEKAGLRVPRKTWETLVRGLRSAQRRDGGWSYYHSGPSSTNCTAHGVACLVIARAALARSEEERRAVLDSDRVKAALRYLGETLDGAFGSAAFRDGAPGATGYTYLAVERAGIATGTRRFGDLDWYLEGARGLLRSQAEDGSWCGGSAIETAYAVLFLLRAWDPVLTPTGEVRPEVATDGDSGDLDLSRARALPERDFRDLVDALLRELVGGSRRALALERIEGLDPRVRPVLVERLDDEGEPVRRAAITALHALTGTTRGFRPDAPAEERRDALDRWKRWLEDGDRR